ncbi:substrate-binding periplasmic protein [Chitinimonas sp.]|uniref:substrate-binding periplasmic protein n=1 Tax=Chitinimonas sp. TaxID=1934313 RepID=UPI002F93A9AC
MKLPCRLALLALTCLAGVVSAQELRLVTAPLPPFTLDSPGPKGAMVDVVQAICTKAGLRCRLEVMPWRRAWSMIDAGSADGIFSILNLPEREARLQMSDDIVESHYALFGPTGIPFNYSGPSSLAGYTIGAYAPSGAYDILKAWLQDIPEVRLVPELDNLTVLKKLNDGGRYGSKGLGFANLDVGQYYIVHNKLNNIAPVFEVKTIRYCVGLSRKTVSPELAASFNSVLRDLQKSGQLARLLAPYSLKPAAARAGS